MSYQERDIVERLRQSHLQVWGVNMRTETTIFSEAADEIERLRNQPAIRATEHTGETP